MRLTKRRVLVLVVTLRSAWAGLGRAQTFRVVGFNVELGGTRPMLSMISLPRRRAWICGASRSPG